MLVGLATFLGAILGLGLVLLLMVRAKPAYYRPVAFDPARIESGAKKVEDKLIELRNVAAEARLADPSGAPQRLVVSFSEEELNAFILKWTELNALRGQYEKHVRDPAVAFEPGRVILAARAVQLPVESVVSLHATARLDAGGLRLAIDDVRAGRLGLPGRLWADAITRVQSSIDDQLPGWRAKAKVDPRTGVANESAVKACYGQLLKRALAGEAVEPVIVIPVNTGSGVPVRLLELKIDDRQVTLTFVPLRPNEAEAFGRRVREGN